MSTAGRCRTARDVGPLPGAPLEREEGQVANYACHNQGGHYTGPRPRGRRATSSQERRWPGADLRLVCDSRTPRMSTNESAQVTKPVKTAKATRPNFRSLHRFAGSRSTVTAYPLEWGWRRAPGPSSGGAPANRRRRQLHSDRPSHRDRVGSDEPVWLLAPARLRPRQPTAPASPRGSSWPTFDLPTCLLRSARSRRSVVGGVDRPPALVQLLRCASPLHPDVQDRRRDRDHSDD